MAVLIVPVFLVTVVVVAFIAVAAAPVVVHEFSAQKAGHGGAGGVLHAEVELREPGRGRDPGGAQSGLAQPVAAEHARVHDRLVDPVPRVGMLRVEDAELGEHVAGFELQAVGQSRRREKGFFDLEGGLSAAGIDRGEQMRLPGEVGIDRAAQRDFRLPQGEAALLRVVGAALQGGKRGVPFARPAGIEQHVRRNVDQAELRVTAQRLPPQRPLPGPGIGGVQLGQGAVQRRGRHPRRRGGGAVRRGLARTRLDLRGRLFLHRLNGLLELADGRLESFDLFAQHLNVGLGAGLCACRTAKAGQGGHPYRQESYNDEVLHDSLVSLVRAGRICRSTRLRSVPAAASRSSRCGRRWGQRTRQ